MRKSLVIFAALTLIAGVAAAELQTVQVGGQLRIRGNYYTNTFATPVIGTRLNRVNPLWPANLLAFRPIGNATAGINSAFRWDSDGNDTSYVEQRTRLNVKADFSQDVSAFIELDSYDTWGEDFRSNYITGADTRPATADDVEVYQAYIQADQMFGMPLRLRVGRQELAFGSQWLMGVNDTSSGFFGLSYDAIRLTYATDQFSIDAFAGQIAPESSPTEEDGDTWIYGIYGSYTGLENITIDAYYFLIRDAASLNDTNYSWFGEWLEDVFNLDDYDVTNLNTIGLRGAGTIGAFDFEAEVAYQWGDAGQVGSLFSPGVYGDDGADFDSWGLNLEVGYTFDMAWQPRVYLGYAYLDGEDNRDVNFWEWLEGALCPWCPWFGLNKPDASVSFNRMFSNWEYSEFLDTDGALSNCQIFRAGVSAMPTESIELKLDVTYMEALDEFAAPAYFTLGRYRIPWAPVFILGIPIDSWLTDDSDNDLGWEVKLSGIYHYSEDLTFEAGWAHLFTGDGLDDGNFTQSNGLAFDGGVDDDDADYLYVETRLAF